jgi:hypothetical protein
MNPRVNQVRDWASGPETSQSQKLLFEKLGHWAAKGNQPGELASNPKHPKQMIQMRTKRGN